MDFDPIAYINTPRWQASRLGLERIRELLERLGRPQDRLKFVHVAGTNGKGSICAYLASILSAAGYRTGMFTSPYIERFEERIRVDGAMISPDELRDVTLAVREHAEAMAEETGDHPTEFELMTAVALEHFARFGCDIVVLEVGLGGRLDSTNVIDAPEACVIARIGLDHTALLGNTLAAIAGEKAGIIKEGSAVVSWPQEPEAMAVIEHAAAEHGCELRVPDFAQLEEGAIRWEDGASPFRSFSYREWTDLRTGILGSYQSQNATVALEVVSVLRGRGWHIPDEAVRAGVARTRWPGRFEIVEGGSSPDGFAIVVDGGHNPQGARALADSLAEVFPGRKPVFVIGVLEDKDYPRMLEDVLPLGSAFVCVTPDNPRALPAHKLARAIRWTGQDLLGCSACVNPVVARDFEDAIRRARELAGPDGLICAFGSLYSVAALKEAVRATR
ncbi:MAG TPA: bifunctional folylpolyglutamate synthase/dihydrofolate synthase [Candidatus Aphodovivens avicola]|nr:bifunctional folylpolyglutamate synthase/dihydrofolate synthase [Candidatus Aphodovivens avicola]